MEGKVYMKEHYEFLKELYDFCNDKGYAIHTGATVEEKKNKKTDEKRTVIKCVIIPIGEKH